MAETIYDEKEEGEIGDDEPEEFDDGYDENLMGDEDDQRRLAQMTEKEREQELFNRSERRECLKTRFKLERKLRLAKREREQEKKQSKHVRARKRLRASEIYSSDESSDVSDEYMPDKSGGDLNSNQKSVSKVVTRSAILSTSSSSSSSASSSASSDSSGEELENDDLHDDDRREIREDFQMSLNELNNLQLKREKIEKWIYEPFFKETAIGLFVKINTGTNITIYKCGQIIDVKQGNLPYAINSEKSATSKTDRIISVRSGQNDRSYQMSFVSNKSFTEEDFQRFIDQIRMNGSHDMPTREFYNRKLKDIDRANNYVYSDEAIEARIKEKTRFQNGPCNLALRKTELLSKKHGAESKGDHKLVRQIERELEELEERAKKLEKERSSKTFSAISFVNERNRIKNIVECEKALRENKIVRTEDPFTRRKCTPQIVSHNKNNGTAKDSSNANGDTGSALETPAKPARSETVDDLFQAHADIELDLDI